ncbi:MAG: PIN domain-containing protein [Chitinivibrionales bacterium]|nr:PIN domain-containing protein [Chitinivibrionales bacterium]
MGFLIDTCIWVDVERGALGPSDVARYTGDHPVFISPVTIAELTFGVHMAANDDIRNRRLAALNRLRRKPLLFIDDITADIFGRIAVSLRRAGKHSHHRVQDIWLASQAIQHGYGLLTENRRDFDDIPGLDLTVIDSER